MSALIQPALALRSEVWRKSCETDEVYRIALKLD